MEEILLQYFYDVSLVIAGGFYGFNTLLLDEFFTSEAKRVWEKFGLSQVDYDNYRNEKRITYPSEVIFKFQKDMTPHCLCVKELLEQFLMEVLEFCTKFDMPGTGKTVILEDTIPQKLVGYLLCDNAPTLIRKIRKKASTLVWCQRKDEYYWYYETPNGLLKQFEYLMQKLGKYDLDYSYSIRVSRELCEKLENDAITTWLLPYYTEALQYISSLQSNQKIEELCLNVEEEEYECGACEFRNQGVHTFPEDWNEKKKQGVRLCDGCWKILLNN